MLWPLRRASPRSVAARSRGRSIWAARLQARGARSSVHRSLTHPSYTSCEPSGRQLELTRGPPCNASSLAECRSHLRSSRAFAAFCSVWGCGLRPLPLPPWAAPVCSRPHVPVLGIGRFAADRCVPAHICPCHLLLAWAGGFLKAEHNSSAARTIGYGLNVMSGDVAEQMGCNLTDNLFTKLASIDREEICN